MSILVSTELAESLASRPVLIKGHADDCVIDTTGRPGTPTRVWISRCGVADGAGHNVVDVEICVNGTWIGSRDEEEERFWFREALMDVNIDSRDAW